MDYKPNFPSSLASEADLATKLKGIGLPDEIVFSVLSCIDDVDYVLELKEQEMLEASLNETTPDDMEEVGVNDKNMYKVTSVLGQLKRGQITKSVAIRILTGLGFTDENAETIVSENMQETKKESKNEKAGA